MATAAVVPAVITTSALGTGISTGCSIIGTVNSIIVEASKGAIGISGFISLVGSLSSSAPSFCSSSLGSGATGSPGSPLLGGMKGGCGARGASHPSGLRIGGAFKPLVGGGATVLVGGGAAISGTFTGGISMLK